jgi:hypothetical protein
VNYFPLPTLVLTGAQELRLTLYLGAISSVCNLQTMINQMIINAVSWGYSAQKIKHRPTHLEVKL